MNICIVFTKGSIKGLGYGQVSNYGKFISNIFGYETVKIGIIKVKVKVQFSVWI